MSEIESVLLRLEAYLADRPVASVGAMVQDARSEILRLRAENENLRAALKPFAYYASQIPDDVSDMASASGTVGDLRAAAAALKEIGE